MPSNYYCADNFFKKMTDLDSPRRNNDCYFYYYSTCAKGDSCTFRHEPSALGCETMCSFWKEGKCLNIHCNFRHMELRKNRKAIQCYWETQPGGCLKPHCPFLHQNVKQSMANYGDNRIGPNTDSAQNVKQSDTVQASEKNYKSSVDSLVVNFEEESDTESAPSPIKIKKANVKTLEEIKLERIQEESAAYFSYHESDYRPPSCETENDLRHRLLHKMKHKRLLEENLPMSKKKKLNFLENASLDDHIKILSTEQKISIPLTRTENNSFEEHLFQKKKLNFGTESKEVKKGVNTIKIKTLTEIRAERLKRRQIPELDSHFNQINLKRLVCSTESENEVSSTSKDEVETKIAHTFQSQLCEMQKSSCSMIIETGANADIKKQVESIEQKKIVSKSDWTLKFENVTEQNDNILNRDENKEASSKVEILKDSPNHAIHGSDTPMEVSTVEFDSISDTSDHLSNKLAEEVLLLDDDEDYANVNLKAEDELLDEIDDILGS